MAQAQTPPIGLEIKRARERLRMTQAELGEAVGVSQKTIDNWEHDRRYPKSSIGALEQVLGISFRSASPARRTAADLTDEERAQALEEFRRLGEQLFGWSGEHEEPEEKPPQLRRRHA